MGTFKKDKETKNKGDKGKEGKGRTRRVLSERNDNEAKKAEGNFKVPKSLKTRQIQASGSGTQRSKTRASKRLAEERQIVDSETDDSKKPVYKKAGLTPLKRAPVVASMTEKLHEYDFEDDETEEIPKTKKKKKAILKIQRVRTYARKKKQVAKEEPAIPLLIQQMLLSTPMKDERDKKRKIDKETVQPHRLLTEDPVKEIAPAQDEPIQSEHCVLPPSPCPSFGGDDCPSSPLAPPKSDGRASFHTVALPTIQFGHITNSSTPNYVTSSTPRYSGNSTRKSQSFLSNMDMNTPIKYHCEVNDFSEIELDEPREFDIDNCFGFDEWDVDPDQLKIKHPPPPPRPKPANLPKPPPMPASEVIKLIESSTVSADEESSMYESQTVDQTTSDDFTTTLADHTSLESFISNASTREIAESRVESPDKTRPRIVRKSYERPLRPRRLLKNKSFEEENSDDDSNDEQEAKDFKQKKKGGKRDVMTKKEEEEFEKWAAMFNAQYREIEKCELIVE